MRTTKLLIAAAVAAAASPAFAGNTVLVQATIGDSCTLDTGLGSLPVSQDAIKLASAVEGNLSVWCTQGYKVKINASSLNTFNLKSGTEVIPYGLWSDLGATTAFVDVAFTGGTTATASNVKYYVKATTAMNPKVGTYEDTLTFTVAP